MNYDSVAKPNGMSASVFISSEDTDDTPHVNTESITSEPRYGSKHKSLCHGNPQSLRLITTESTR